MNLFLSKYTINQMLKNGGYKLVIRVSTSPLSSVFIDRFSLPMDNPPQLNSNHFSIIDLLESRSFSWIFVADHHDPWRATASWILFFLLTFLTPVFSHFAFQCSACDYNHRRPFDLIVQVSLSVFSTLSFVSLWRFTRKYGLRRFLFLDELDAVNDKVRRRYSEELHVRFLINFCFLMLLIGTSITPWIAFPIFPFLLGLLFVINIEYSP